MSCRFVWLLAAFLAPSAFADGVIAHLAAGYGWETGITLVNTTAFAETVSVGFFDGSGSPLTLDVHGLGQSPGYNINLPGYGMSVVFMSGPVDHVVDGYATVAGRTVSGNAVFKWTVAGKPDFEASVPITQMSQRLVFPFDNADAYVTGIALANMGESIVHVTIRDWSGTIIGTHSLSIKPHQAFVLADAYPETANTAGTIEFLTIGDNGAGAAVISAIALWFNPTGPFTTITPAYAGTI